MFYWKKIKQKKLLQSKDLKIHSSLHNELKKQIDIAKNNIKDSTKFMNSVKRVVLKN